MENQPITTPNHPRYLSIFTEYCMKAAQFNVTSATHEALNYASWEYAIFTHSVLSKHFFNGLQHLQNTNASLERLCSQLKDDQNVDEYGKEAIKKIKLLTQKVQRQYEEFLEKKSLH